MIRIPGKNVVRLVLLTLAVAAVEFVALVYQPDWIWATAGLLTVLVYALAMVRSHKLDAIGYLVIAIVVVVITWTYFRAAIFGREADALPSLFYALLYAGLIGSGLVLVWRLLRRQKPAHNGLADPESR